MKICDICVCTYLSTVMAKCWTMALGSSLLRKTVFGNPALMEMRAPRICFAPIHTCIYIHIWISICKLILNHTLYNWIKILIIIYMYILPWSNIWSSFALFTTSENNFANKSNNTVCMYVGSPRIRLRNWETASGGPLLRARKSMMPICSHQ